MRDSITAKERLSFEQPKAANFGYVSFARKSATFLIDGKKVHVKNDGGNVIIESAEADIWEESAHTLLNNLGLLKEGMQ
jgi:hypothetical protein